MDRFWKFRDVPEDLWMDWKWQLKNRLSNNSDLKEIFPNISIKELNGFRDYVKKYNFAITPYTLSLVELDEELNPKKDDPVWSQFRFYSKEETEGVSDYDGRRENWEESSEMPTRILQHKYPDRAIIRIINTCFGHCNYCYLTSRVLDKDTSKDKKGDGSEWEKTLRYLRNKPAVRDVLISGGEPLLLNNERLERIFFDLSLIPSIRSIRLNTRTLTFNPYRFDKDMVSLFKKYRLTALEIHTVHPVEINDVFDERLKLFDDMGYRPMILWRAPLLKGINDKVEVLEELFMKLYERRITPYYLFHYAPFTLGRSTYGLGVRKGSMLMAELRRRIPGPAVPRYTLFHIEGKQDIPLEQEGNSSFIYTSDEKGNPVVKFKNWKNKWVEYPDIDDGF
ncbi:MAG: KamA family radical SAM protein [Bacillota bacterium]